MILASVSTISTTIGRSNDRNRGLGGSRDPAFLANRARDHGRRRNNLATNTSSAPPCCRERQLLAAASNGAAREGLAISQIRFAAVERPWMSRKNGLFRKMRVA